MASEEKKNIVIIGGGIIGCTSAYFLSRHPSYDPSKHKITLLEASKIAGGASGKAGGLLALWAYPSSIVPLSYRLHKELADEHGGADRWGYRALSVGQIDVQGRDHSTTNGVNGDGAGKESLSLQKRSKEAMAKLKKAGIPEDLDWIDPECSPRYDEMGDPTTTAQVHPYQFTTSMAELAKEKGVDVRTGTKVTSINYTSDSKGVEGVTFEDKSTGSKETIEATDIIVSAGPWTSSVLPSAPISAMRAHSVTITPSRPVSAYALFTQIQMPPSKGSRRGETVTPEIYARPFNSVYACGPGDHLIPLPETSEEVQCDESRCQDIMDQVGAISTELREGEVTARQACYLPSVAAAAGGPLVGHTGVKGLVLATGHTCWGIQNGPGTGKLVSEFVFEGEAKSAKIKGLDPRHVL